MADYQRAGALSNAHVGRDFLARVEAHLAEGGLSLEREFAVPIGFARKKLVPFNLGCATPPTLVFCKAYTWTEGGNVPSAKLRGLNEALLKFSIAPPEYRKLLFVTRDTRRDESLAAYFVRTSGHLIPENAEVWEYDEVNECANRLV